MSINSATCYLYRDVSHLMYRVKIVTWKNVRANRISYVKCTTLHYVVHTIRPYEPILMTKSTLRLVRDCGKYLHTTSQ